MILLYFDFILLRILCFNEKQNKNIFIVAQHSILIIKIVSVQSQTHTHLNIHTQEISHKSSTTVQFSNIHLPLFLFCTIFLYACVSTVMPRVKFFSSFNEKKKRKKSNKNEFFSSDFSEA